MAKLRTLERLSKNALRRMGLKTIEDSLEEMVEEKVNTVIANLKAEVTSRGGGWISVSTGLRSSPTPGSKKVTNLFVTPEGKLEIFYEMD